MQVSWFAIAEPSKICTIPIFELPCLERVDFYENVDPQKLEAKKDLACAIEWKKEEGANEKPVTAARIFNVKSNSISQAMIRAGKRTRNRKGVYNTHGDNNKVLSEAQEEAICQYCYEQWAQGLGATKPIVYAAISFLKALESPPQEPLSWRWFTLWIKQNPFLYTIKTKPIERERLDTNTEDNVKRWFDKYKDKLAKYNIRKRKNILNIDKSGARAGCPKGEEVIILIYVKELYTPSPENRKSVTIIKTIYTDRRKPIPLLIIVLGKQIIDNWIHDNLVGNKTLTTSLSGYTNNTIIIEYLEHLVEHTSAGPEKP